MTFNSNLHNPIPLHTSKNLWYCRARHAESMINYFPALPLNTIPRFQLTSPDFPNALPRTAYANIRPFTAGVQPVYEGYLNGTLNDNYTCTLSGRLAPHGTPFLVGFTVAIERAYNNFYYISINGCYICESQLGIIARTKFTKTQIEQGLLGQYKYYNGNFWAGTLVSLTGVDLDYTGSNEYEYTINVRDYKDDSIVHTLTSSAVFTVVPSQYASSSIRSYVAIGGDVAASLTTTVGTYYVELIIDSQTWYSEPFCWVDNIHDYVQVRYRRTSPIITADNYIAFVDQQGNNIYAVMYLPTTLLAPPYKFEQTIEEVDGVKFIQKLVSYRSEKLEFFCTGYFAEALRILWHCNLKTISQQPEPQKLVDFMEAPEINWDNDTHYCSAVIIFNTDTIIQTNGNVELDMAQINVRHSSYDNSFDISFN